MSSSGVRLYLDPKYTRVRPGWYIPAKTWTAFSPEDQHLARLIVANEVSNEPPVFSHVSAAVLHGLPTYIPSGSSIHTIGPRHDSSHSSSFVTRHRQPVARDEITTISGVRCTTLERTLKDLALTFPLETSVAAPDGYAHANFTVGRKIDWHSFHEWRASVQEHFSTLRGHRGIRSARYALTLVDPRIESVLESLSHVQFCRLGFDVDLQVCIPAPKGRNFYVDFELRGLDILGECDGKVKYLRDSQETGINVGEILYLEKRRQEWITQTTGKRLIRWGIGEVTTPAAFSSFLRAIRVPLPRH